MKNNAQKLKQRLKQFSAKIESGKTKTYACSDVKSKNELNAIVVLLNRLGYRHDKDKTNHIEDWDNFLSVLNGEPHMGISVLPRSKTYIVLNWKPSHDWVDRHQCIKMI